MVLLNSVYALTDQYLYIGFSLILVVSLGLDLWFLTRQKSGMSIKSAVIQSACWVFFAFIFGIALYFTEGKSVSVEFFSAYIMEYSLSMDNIFVFVLILNYFRVSPKYYAKVLFYGILMAIIFRLLFISVGVVVVTQFQWILYVFGAFLIYTGYKILFAKEEDEFDPESSLIYKMMQKYFAIADHEGEGNFTIRVEGKKFYTRLFLVIAIIGTTDVLFALDSIPAAFAITQHMLVIVTSNILAVIGLRAMFFMLMNAVGKFVYLQQGISLVLIFIGLKMLAEIVYFHVSTEISLAVIASILGGSVVISLLVSKKKRDSSDSKLN